MTAHLIRRIAILLVALYASGQVALAQAACGFDRGAMAQAMTMAAGDTCDDCGQVATDTLTATCVAHCTADLQLKPSDPVSIPDAGFAPLPTLRKPPLETGPPLSAELLAAAVPRRILLHSFQI